MITMKRQITEVTVGWGRLDVNAIPTAPSRAKRHSHAEPDKKCPYCDSLNYQWRENCHSCGAPFTEVKKGEEAKPYAAKLPQIIAALKEDMSHTQVARMFGVNVGTVKFVAKSLGGV